MSQTEAYFKGHLRYTWRTSAPVELTIVTCWCGMPYAIPTDLYREMKRTTQQSSYCPMGHTMILQEGNEAEIRRLQSTLSAERDQHDATRRSLKAQRAATTRVKNRARAGVCPDCKRSFSNVRAHMQTVHPELAP